MGSNLIVLVADTLRGPQSFPGGTFERAAPFLTALSAAGHSLPNFVASSSWTYPSHLALLHGAEPWEVPAPRRSSARPSTATLAELSSRRGLASAAFSRNPIVSPATGLLRGYGEVHPEALAIRSGLAARLNCMWDPLVGSLAHPPPPHSLASGPHRAAGAAASVVASGLARFARASFGSRELLPALRHYLRGRDRRRATHLFVNLMEAHEPYLAPERGPSAAPGTGIPPSSNLAYHAATGSIPAGSAPQLASLYLDALRAVDRRLADVFSILRREEMLERATVVVVSDHGQSLGEHGFYGHGRYLYDELVRVPCILWSSAPDTHESGALTQFWDHRHLYEILRRSLDSEAPPSDADWEEASRLRGPAYAHVRWRGFEGHNPFRRTPAREGWRRFPLLSVRSVKQARTPTLSEYSAPTVRPSVGWEADATRLPAWQESLLGEDEAVAGPALPLESWGYGE